MAQNTDDASSQLWQWQRPAALFRDNFSGASVEALPSLPSGPPSLDDERTGETADGEPPCHAWDENISSVVNTLDELTLQSPNTTETHSPGTPWFPDREAYSETALTSPGHSGSPRTARSSRNPVAPPRVDVVGSSEKKGKGLAPLHGEQQRSWRAADLGTSTPFLIHRQLLYEANAADRFAPDAAATAATGTTTTTTAIPHTPAGQAPNPPATQVHALMLTWAKHDRRGDDGQLLSPGLDSGTGTLRDCLKRRGYRVQCRLIPGDYPTAAVETLLARFLDKSAPDSLLVIYYHGFGNLDGQGRMVFSSGPDASASSFFWDDVRDPIMQAPGDVLLIFDCTALPGTGAEQHEMRVEPGTVASPSAKQLLGVCVPSSSRAATPDAALTQSLCRTLDKAGRHAVPALSVQRLCSLMRDDACETGLASRVFVSQLAGGQLVDTYLPRIAVSPGPRRHSVVGGGWQDGQ